MYQPYRIQSGIKKIAVLRANAIGDLVFGLPALEALRAAYPEAEIILLGQPWHVRFLQGRPGPIDRVIEIPSISALYQDSDGRPEATSTQKALFFHQMQNEKFDLAIQMHGGGRNSNPFVLQLGARITAGMCTPDAPTPDIWMRYIYWQPEILRCLEVVSLVGAKPFGVRPKLDVTTRDIIESEQVVPPDDRPLAVLNPGAGDGRRRWPAAKFAAVGDALAAQGMRVAVTGAGFDAVLVQSVVSSMKAPALNLAGSLSLGGLAGLLWRSGLMVSNDSGPLHLAEALDVPTVGIYWCGNMIIADPMTRNRHRPLISWQLICPVCGVNTIEQPCPDRESFVADVPTEGVIEQALDLVHAEEEVAAVSAT